MSDSTTVTGYCGSDLKIKEWKQGTSMECLRKEEKVVTYPHIDVGPAVGEMCFHCRHSPMRQKEEKA